MSNDPYAITPEEEAYHAARAQECGAEYVSGGSDPSGTDCDLKAGHAGPHEGGDPFGGSGRFEWTGGGSVAGDPLPVTSTRHIRTEAERLVAEFDATQHEPDGSVILPPLGNCEWFALCTNTATGRIAHPILGAVPVCDRCAHFANSNKPTN